MKKQNAEIEMYRVKKGVFASDTSYGNNGHFIIPHPKIAGVMLYVVCSDGLGWDHVSISLVGSKVDRCPNWGEMCFAKDLFFEPNETVIQFHPPKDQHVSTHPYCLHLWRPQFHIIPLPDHSMVGFKGDNNQKF
jgi:hypothetical protein